MERIFDILEFITDLVLFFLDFVLNIGFRLMYLILGVATTGVVASFAQHFIKEYLK